MFEKELILRVFHSVYEYSSPFLTLDPCFDSRGMPIDLSDYVKQFWISKRKNKVTAQSLLTVSELIENVQRTYSQAKDDVLQLIVDELLKIGAVLSLEIDVEGANVEKLLLTPLGLALWRSIDEGALFNQEKVSEEYLSQLLTESWLIGLLKAENTAWLDLNQIKLAIAKGRINPQSVCFGFYLLLNGAIAQGHALHLVRGPQKHYKWHKTLVDGLNVVARYLFNEDDLFKEHSLKDDLQRRSDLINKVGAPFIWKEPRKDEVVEYYWWEIKSYSENSSTLDYVVKTLVHSIPIDEELGPIETRLTEVLNYFRNKTNYDLALSEMMDLFPAQPSYSYNYILRSSIDKAVAEILAGGNTRKRPRNRSKK